MSYDRETLEFVVRHCLHRSIKAIAATAGADTGNLHASLAGRRPLPPETARRVAAAVGLRTQEENGVMGLKIVPNTILNLEVPVDKLPQLANALRALGNPSPSWRLVSGLWSDLYEFSEGDEVEAQPGVYTIAVGRMQNSHILVHINWPSLSSVFAALKTPAGIKEQLGGHWDKADPEPGLSFGDVPWIRMRSGLCAAPELDALFGVAKAQPTGEDWARLLATASQQQFTPDEIIQMLTTQR